MEVVAAPEALAAELAEWEVDDTDWLLTPAAEVVPAGVVTGVLAAVVAATTGVVTATEPEAEPAAVEAGAADALKQEVSVLVLIVKGPEGLVRPSESRMTRVY